MHAHTLTASSAGTSSINQRMSLKDISDDVRGIYDACCPLAELTYYNMPDVLEASTRLSQRPIDAVRIAGA